MATKKAVLILLAVFMALTTVLSGCAGGKAKGPVLNWNLGTEPPTADPALATDTTSVQVDQALFLGLTDFNDETMEVVPELAKEWDVSDDGLIWTFTLREDVHWVDYDPESGKAKKLDKVTAHDVEYAVKRTINPETASDYAYVDYIIKNAEAVNSGESTDLDSIGVKALDDYTVQFTLERPAGYFPAIAGMWVNRPVPQDTIEQYGDTWTEAANIVTNGPYCLDTWEHESSMVFVKNPHYYAADDVQIAKVNCVMVTEASTAFAMYENGELDVQSPPMEDMDRVKADPELSEELYMAPSLCTYYYGYNVTKAPFDDPKVRQAFSYAFDRQKLIDTVTKGDQKPAQTFACPGIFGTPAENPDFPGITFDPAKAKELLAEAGYPDGEGLPEITLMFNTSEGHQKIAQFAQQTWKENLGVEVKLANQEWKVYLDTLTEDSPQIWRLGWCADYPDENNWVLEVFHPKKGSNRAKWDVESPSAKKFMELTEQAAEEPDPAKREELYFEAEKILCADQAIIIPIYYYTRVVCTKPYVNRTYAPLGGEHWEQWTIEKE
ncbi:MAG: peptide ABC transporter substrate-binding protein [Chloroflexota bacterium]|nr:peptide ABC transporter substrate-binding protein [Chloroflexota bacterium]